MTTLVIGGAGYIGAHVVQLLLERGESVAVVDDLSTGFRNRIGDAPLIEQDVTADGAVEVLEREMRERGVKAVIHFAAHKQVGESVEKPEMYWHDNIGGLANVLDAAARAGVRDFVFSSSAAVYGTPDVDLVDEELECRPINPYGATKYVGEWMLADAERAHGMRTVALRYFNVAGAGSPELADTRKFSVTTTTPLTAPASATTSTSRISPTRTSPPSATSKTTSASTACSTWAPERARAFSK